MTCTIISNEKHLTVNVVPESYFDLNTWIIDELCFNGTDPAQKIRRHEFLLHNKYFETSLKSSNTCIMSQHHKMVKLAHKNLVSRRTIKAIPIH